MKLQSTLEERPGFLHVLPLFDLFALATMLLMLGPLFLSQSGILVEVPVSQFQMERFQKSIVITLGPGDVPSLYLGRQAVSLEELENNLENLSLDETMSRSIVLLKADVGTPVGFERKVSEMILGKGFKVALVGRAASLQSPSESDEKASQ